MRRVFDHAGVRRRRIAAGLTCEQLGFLIRRTAGQVQHLENGRSQPSVHVLLALGAAFDVDLAELFVDAPEPAEIAA